MNGRPSTIKYPSRAPIAFGIIGTLACLTAGVFLWLDNQEGFRNADAFATLVSADFSMIATIWLVVAVFRQGEELRLQREELALQREELKLHRFEFAKQSNEFSILNRQSATQILILIRKDIEESLTNYLITDIERIRQYGNTARGYAADYLSNFTGFEADPNKIEIHKEGKNYYIKPDNEYIKNVSISYPNFLTVRYIKIPASSKGELESLYRDKVINELFQIASTHGCASWFLDALPFTMRPIAGVSRRQIATVLRSNVNE